MSAQPQPVTVQFVSPLAELIERVRQQEAEATGTKPTYAELARRGTDLTKQNVARYAGKPFNAAPGLELEKRRGLALALRVHPVVVDLAMAQSLGLTLPSFNLDDDYRLDPELTGEDRKVISDFINYRKQLHRNAGQTGRKSHHG